MKQAGYALLLLFFACHVQTARSAMQVGAYYYPWYTSSNFHVKSGQPTGSTTVGYHLEPTQVLPALGWYDQDHASVTSQHYEWARYAGIKFFVCSYWGSGSTTDNCIRNRMFNNPDRGDIKLCVFLEPRITPADNDPDKPEDDITAAEITAQTNYLCDNYFNQPFYLHIDGKPVIFIYVTRSMTNTELTMCLDTIRTAAANKGIGDVYLACDEVWKGPSTSIDGPRVSQMDAITNYDVYGNNSSTPFVTDSVLDTWQSRNAAWKSLADSYGTDLIPAISPGFNDRTVRLESDHKACSRKLNNESNDFGTLFTGMIDRLEPGVEMIMINSWNEWHEDTQIEPTTVTAPTNVDDSVTGDAYTEGVYYEGYGMRYLDILRELTCSVEGDLNSDCYVDYLDLADLREGWLTTYDMLDLILIAQNWLGTSQAVAYWRLDETAGVVASDSSGSGYNGTLMNMDDSDWVLGNTGNALDFDGANDYVEITGYQGVLGSQSRTVTAWIKTTGTGAIVSWGDSDISGSWWLFRIEDAGRLRLQTQGGAIVGSTDLRGTAWHHVAVVLADDGSPDNAEVKLYVDGVEETYSGITSQPINTASHSNVTIGTSYLYDGTVVVPFTGQIDDVKIYDRALNEAEIAMLAQ